MNIQTAWLTLGVPNFPEVVDFYQTLLDQTPHPYNPGRYAEFSLPGLRLGIFAPHPQQIPEFRTASPGGFSLCLTVADLETAIARLQTLNVGINPEAIRTASHGREIYGYDPGGNRFIVYQPIAEPDGVKSAVGDRNGPGTRGDGVGDSTPGAGVAGPE